MRKILSSIMLVAVAAMASVSCQKEENAPANETKSATLTLYADVDNTKTYIDAENTIIWGTDEYVQLYFNDGVKSQFVKSNGTYANEWDGSDEAKFAFDLEYTQAGSYVLGGVYPASATTADNNSPTAYKVDLAATQEATTSSYDPAAFIMIMKPQTVADEDFDKTSHIASFRRAVALNKITLKGLKETINSITITVPEEKYLAGRRYFDLTTGEEGEIYHAQSNSITVNGTYNAGDVDVWFTSWGVELVQNEEMTIKMTSATKAYTRTITVKDGGLKFIEGALNNLTVNMSSADEVVLDNFAGEYLIVNKDLTRAAQAWNGGNNLPEYVLTVEDGTIIESDGLENCKMTIELQSDGKYTIKDAKNKYLYAPSSSNNYLNGADELSDLTDWTIVKDGDKYVLISSGNNSKNILRYNSSSKIFSCYSSGQADVTLYKYSEIQPDTRPSVTVAESTSVSIGAEGGDLTFTCTIKNLDGETLEVVEDSDYLTWAVAENVVTITVAANEGAESRTLNATIKCGSVEVPVTINQAAAGSEASGWISKPFADLKAGDQVVIVATKGSDFWAMSNDKGTSAAPTGVTDVKYENDKLTAEPAANIIWYVGVDGNNRIFYKDSDEKAWLYCTSTNNGVRVGTNTANTFVLEDGYLKHNGTSRYVGVYPTTPDWRCYTNTTGNIANQTFQFFVKSGESSGEEGGETPTDPVQLIMSEITCSAQTENSLTFTWTAVANATGYEVTCNNKTVTVNDVEYTATGLTASTEYTISVKAVGDDIYYTTSDAKTQTGTTSAAQGGGTTEPEEPEVTKEWKLVTDASSLKAGDKIAIVSDSKGKIAGSLTTQYLSSIDVTISDETFSTLPTGAVEFNLGGASGSWTLVGSDGKLLGATAVKKLAWDTGTTTWTISINDRNATIQNTNDTYGRILYNVNSPRFTTYTSNTSASMLLPQIYRYE